METERVGRAGPTRLLFVPFRDGGDVLGYPLGHASVGGGPPPAASMCAQREGPGRRPAPEERQEVSREERRLEERLLLEVVLHHGRDGISLLIVDRRRDAQVRDAVVLLRASSRRPAILRCPIISKVIVNVDWLALIWCGFVR